jgi:hypothetical protein
MAQQTSSVEQPATESPDVDALLDAKFGTGEEPSDQQDTQQPEASDGEEAAAASESETESQEPEFVEVEFQGNKYQVPPELKDALMAQADYTSKTTEVANTRRVLDLQAKEVQLFNEQRAFEQSMEADVDRLKMFDAYIQHTKSSTNWASLSTDQVVRAKLELDQLSEQRSELAQALKSKRDEFTAKLNGERSKIKESAREILSKAIPNWSDETRASVEKYAQSLGYPEIAVQNMSALDSQIAWKAMQYDKIRAESKSAVKKADAPVIAPTARRTPMPQKVRANLDLKNAMKSGKQANINVALDKRLEQLFGG